jgi:hypothetical protein
VERLASDEHFSLLQTFINYRRKMFYTIVPWLCFCKPNCE